MTPLENPTSARDIRISEQTRELLRAGKVACVILAGGQGSRLGSSLPKALIPLLPTGETFLEVTLAKRRGNLPIALMTSTQNQSQISSFIAQKKLQGISLFAQRDLPLLDDEEREVRDKTGQLVTGPCGNGDFFPSFAKSGILEKWAEQGIAEVMLIFIDNPLADPFDLKLLQHHLRSHAEVTLKCIERKDPAESVGVVALEEGKLCTKEYFELSQEEKEARRPDGSLLFSLANSGMYLFSLPFLRKAARVELPYHFARKEVLVDGQRCSLWKRETFIFDILPYAERAEALLFDRHEVFAPVKDKESLLQAQAHLTSQ